jgi:hypothetical protein
MDSLREMIKVGINILENKMDRRSFFKMTGLTVASVTAVGLADTPDERWVNFTDQMPRVGQKIAVFTYFENNSRNILTGEVVREEIDSRYGSIGSVVSIDMAMSYSLDKHFVDCDIHVFPKLNMTLFEAVAKVDQSTWIKRKIIQPIAGRMIAPRHGLKKSDYIGRKESYWFPVDGYIPKDLPALPVPQRVKVITKNEKQILIKG